MTIPHNTSCTPNLGASLAITTCIICSPWNESGSHISCRSSWHFHQPLRIKDNYVAFALFFLVGFPSCGVTTGVICAFFCVFYLGVTVPVFPVVENFSFNLIQSPFRVFALGQCSPKMLYFLSKVTGPVQTTVALWIRVLTTLYLAARLWWLSHCKYCAWVFYIL